MRNLENVIKTNPTHLEHMATQASPEARAALLVNVDEERAYRDGSQNDRPDDWRVNDLSNQGLENLRSALKRATALRHELDAADYESAGLYDEADAERKAAAKARKQVVTTRMETTDGHHAGMCKDCGAAIPLDKPRCDECANELDELVDRCAPSRSTTLTAADVERKAQKRAEAQTPPAQVVLHWVGMDVATVARKVSSMGSAKQAAVHAALYVEAVRDAVDIADDDKGFIVEAFIAALS